MGMQIWITKEMQEKIGVKVLQPYGLPSKIMYEGSQQGISLTRFSNAKVKALHKLIEPHWKTLKGARVALRDLNVWLEAMEVGAHKTKCKNCKHFAAMAIEWLEKVPKHWLYWKDEERGVWRAFYVGNIKWFEREVQHGYVNPAHTDLTLYFHELDYIDTETLSFRDEACQHLTAPEILAARGYIPETPDLLKEYEGHDLRHDKYYDKVGLQFLASGVGISDLDGNPEVQRHNWYYKMTQTFRIERDGQPARVVLDIRQESEEEKDNDNDKKHPDLMFWVGKSYLEDEDDVDPDDLKPEDVDDKPLPEIKVPRFPVVATFDLRRHLRLRIHIGNLKEYKYDTKLGRKLVLPQDQRSLVDMLLHHKGGFKDIISGKTGGAIILCAGIPGTGKTLTAEVYSEVASRPLYSVQCSQLGVSPQQLEGELLKVFVRAQRWNAILLLDEADVYVAQRGHDLQQNAIVGVFLRVLEYYSGVLFLTTNRVDLVDDAIASRCIARIDFKAPSRINQWKIWRILADTMGIKLEKETISKITHDHPKLTGRDIKNLLKLAMLVSSSSGKPITPKMVSFVKRFKPTYDGPVVQPDGRPVVVFKDPESVDTGDGD